MAGRSRFRHGRKRSASGVLTVRQEDRSPLERLAGYLETELATKESKVEEKYPRRKIDFFLFKLPLGCRQQKHTEYKNLRKTVIHLGPTGKRHPRVSHHKGHITVSWQGDLQYHRQTWHKKIKAPASLDYEANIFFKGTLAAPNDWNKVYADFGGVTQGGSQEAWDNITSNNFVVVTRNTAAALKNPCRFSVPLLSLLARIPWVAKFTPVLKWRVRALRKIPSVAYLPGLLGGHGDAFNRSLGPLQRWHWFGFPGIGQKPEPGGQFVDRIPGMKKSRALGFWPRGNTSVGHCMFKDEDDCGLAIVTKVYPKRRKAESHPFLELRFQIISSALRLALLIGSICGLPYLAYWGVSSYLTHEERAVLEVALEEATTENEVLTEKNVALSEDNETLAEEKDVLSGENADLKTKAESTGLDKRPCWYDKDTGVEYLLKIKISDAGLEILPAPRKLPLRDKWNKEYESLPFNKNLIGQTITAERFLVEFRTTYDVTVASECRHFVKVDEGVHAQTNHYKHDRDIIESYFYIKREQFGTF